MSLSTCLVHGHRRASRRRCILEPALRDGLQPLGEDYAITGTYKMAIAEMAKGVRVRMMKSEYKLRWLVAVLGILTTALLVAATAAAQRPERPALRITGYVIDAELETETHHIAAKAAVTFTAP